MCAQTSDAPGPGAEEVAVALDAFLAVQQQRAQLYHLFDEGHRQYLRSKAEGPYRHIMTQLTGEFSRCSNEINALRERLAGPLGQPAAAALLRELQQQEQAKLQLTLSLQALKAAHAHRRFSWQQQQQQQEEEEAGAGGVGWPGHVCGVGCTHQGLAEEPTQAEYDAAVKESYQQLQAAVTSINDIIGEVRQLAAELRGEESEGEGGLQ